jgi:hypothetical protein
MKLAVALLSSFICVSSYAKDVAYNYFEIGYTNLEDSNLSLFANDADNETGYFLRGKVTVSDGAYINFSREHLQGDFDVKLVGYGVYKEASKTLSFYGSIDYAKLESDNGYHVALGARFKPSDLVEIYGEAEKISVDEYKSIGINVGGRLYLIEEISLFAEYHSREQKMELNLMNLNDDITGYRVGLQLNF